MIAIFPMAQWRPQHSLLNDCLPFHNLVTPWLLGLQHKTDAFEHVDMWLPCAVTAPSPRLQQQLVLVLFALPDRFLAVLHHCQRGYYPPQWMRSINAILFPLFLSCLRPLHALSPAAIFLCVTKPAFYGHQTPLPIQSDPLPSFSWDTCAHQILCSHAYCQGVGTA